MMLPLVLAVLLPGSGVPTARLVTEIKGHVTGLDWSPTHKLLIVTDKNVREWPSGRSAPLHAMKPDPNMALLPGIASSLAWNRDGSRGIGDGFMLDARTLRSTPLGRSAVWDGNDVLRVEQVDDTFRFLRDGKKIPIAPGWHVTGVSADCKFALATRSVPSDYVDTMLLSINPRTGAARKIFTFPNSSDDHTVLCEIDYNRGLGTWLLHDLGVGIFEQPYIAGPKLRKLKLPSPVSPEETSCSLSWLADGSPWTLASRQFFNEKNNGGEGFDAYAYDLWNVKTGQIVHLVKTINRWKGTSDFNIDVRDKIPLPYSPRVDWSTKRFAYMVAGNGWTKVYMLSFASLLPAGKQSR